MRVCGGGARLKMRDDAATAKRYRARAKEIRAIADAVPDRRSRSILLRVAADYEKLARLRIRVGKADRDSSTIQLP